MMPPESNKLPPGTTEADISIDFMKITNGSIVRDRISGFKGEVICRSEWHYGCVRLTVQSSKLQDGKPVEPQTFDEPQLEVIKAAPDKAPPQPGGARTSPTQHAGPVR